MGVRAFFFAVLLICAPFAAAQQEVAPDEPVTTPRAVQFRLERAAASIDQIRFTAALSDLDAAIASTAMDPVQEDWAHYLRARALAGAGRAGDGETEARAHFLKRPSAYNFKSILTVLAIRQRWLPAAQALLELPDAQFAFANGASVTLVSGIVDGLSDGGQVEIKDRLLARLVTANYTGPFGGKTDDGLRLEYITRLLASGRVEDAAQQTKFLETPSIMIALLTDRSYEALWSTAQISALSAKDMQARVQARAAALVNRGIQHGGEALEAVRAFRAAGDPARALETAEKSLPVIMHKPEGRRYARLILIEKAYALADLGRASQSFAAFDQILRDFPDDPVPVRLAYARVLEAAAQGAKALAVLEPLDPEGLSTPARAVALQVTVCAQAGQASAQGKEALLELQDMGFNAAPALLDALLCVKQDEAAKTLINGWLLRSDIRRGAIAALQLYAEPSSVLPSLAERRRRLQALIAREDVQTALKPYGRTMGWSFQRATALSY